jgi:hypothetical protein
MKKRCDWPSRPEDLIFNQNDTWNSYQKMYRGAQVSSSDWRAAREKLHREFYALQAKVHITENVICRSKVTSPEFSGLNESPVTRARDSRDDSPARIYQKPLYSDSGTAELSNIGQSVHGSLKRAYEPTVASSKRVCKAIRAEHGPAESTPPSDEGNVDESNDQLDYAAHLLWYLIANGGNSCT